MRSYECMWILAPDEETTIKAKVNQIEKLITTNKGHVPKASELWGVKRMYVNIKDQSSGFYILTQFKADAGCVKALDKALRQDESVLRHMIIKLAA